MSKVLVTGASGFIGTHLVERLLQDGHQVCTFDLTPPQLADSEWERKGLLQWSQGDITDEGEALLATHGMDVVYHLAQPADINTVKNDPLRVIKDCVVGTALMLDAAQQHKVKRFIYASSTYVYSDHGHLYTTTKRCCEGLVKNWHTLYGLPYTILRFGTIYGPGSRSVVGIFIKKALAGEPLTIHGEGKQSRRFVYIDDIIEGCVKAMRPEAENGTYTLVGEEPASIVRIGATIGGILDRELDIDRQPAREDDYVEELPPNTQLELECQQGLGWGPKVLIEEGIRRTVEWQREQNTGFTA